MKARSLYVAFVLLAGAYACSEATDGILPYDVRITPGAAQDEDDDVETGGDGEPGPPKGLDAATVTSGVVVLNEIGVGGEWIEVVNSGDGEVDVSGWQVADRDKDTGEPKLKDGVTFPEGTKLGPGRYLLVKCGGADSGDPCPNAGKAEHCLHAEFGISNKNGETIFLLARDGGVQGTVVYPPDAANGDDISWSRLPNGDPGGSFVLAPATPAAANAP